MNMELQKKKKKTAVSQYSEIPILEHPASQQK